MIIRRRRRNRVNLCDIFKQDIELQEKEARLALLNANFHINSDGGMEIIMNLQEPISVNSTVDSFVPTAKLVGDYHLQVIAHAGRTIKVLETTRFQGLR